MHFKIKQIGPNCLKCVKRMGLVYQKIEILKIVTRLYTYHQTILGFLKFVQK